MTVTATYDPEQWQLVPKVATKQMLKDAEMFELANGQSVWECILDSAPQHPDTLKVPRPEGHDSWSIEIKTAFGGGGGGGSYPDTGETTLPESNSPT